MAGFFISGNMRYQKPSLNFHNQAQLLINRGLIADLNELESFLSIVNYYRFSGYLFPFRSGINESFIPNTTFNFIKEIYYFDIELRKFTFSFIGIIEIALLRTQMVEKFSLENGPFCYSNISNFGPSLSEDTHKEIMGRIFENIEKSNEVFVKAYKTKYSEEPYFPFWIVSETLSFGVLSQIFSYLPHNILISISNRYNLYSTVLSSWLHTLSTIRNICAHHARLWNRKLSTSPLIPYREYHPEFYTPTKISPNHYSVILAILNYLLTKINPNISVMNDFKDLLRKYPTIPLNRMGFPDDWEQIEIFRAIE
jgi:abortive infection bacteriophage resistance protein